MVNLTLLQQRILQLLFTRAGQELNQRRIAILLSVSAPAVMKALPGLKSLDLINLEQDKESKRWAIKLNLENHRVTQLKRTDNLKQIYESGLADFLEEKLAGAAIVLFGSYARGEDTIRSDIDIAVIGRKSKPIDLKQFEKILNRVININFYTSWSDIHKHLKNNILNGIILSGSVDL